MYPDVIAIRGQREEEKKTRVLLLLSASWATCAARTSSVLLNQDTKTD